MNQRTPYLVILASGVAALFAGCAVRTAPVDDEQSMGGDEGTGASEQGGTAGSTGGTGGSQSCTGGTPSYFVACWGPVSRSAEGGSSSGEDSYLEHFAPDLRVVDAVDPDLGLCNEGFPGMSFRGGNETAPFVAWELEDGEGVRWVVQFAVAGATPDLLATGDVVDFRYIAATDGTHGIPHGWVALERAGWPAIGFALDRLSESVPDLVIEAAQAMCAEDEDEHCLVSRAVRIEANGESDVVPEGEEAEVGGLTVFNGRYVDNRECQLGQTPPPLPEEFLLGFQSATLGQ